MCVCCSCSAGAGRTGTFCALSTVLERVKAEGILDVFQTVKSLRLQRPHMVQTLVRIVVMLKKQLNWLIFERRISGKMRRLIFSRFAHKNTEKVVD